MKNTSEALFKTVSLRPYTQLCTSVHQRMYYIIGLLLLQVLLLLITKSWSSLIIIGATVLAAFAAEASELLQLERKPLNWQRALRNGLLIGLLLPNTYSPLIAFFVTLAVVLVCTWLLGGEVQSWVNPPALAIAVCWLIGMRLFPAYPLSIDVLQARNATQQLMQSGVFSKLAADSQLTAVLNKTVYNRLGATVPEGYLSLLWDSQAAIPAFRFNALTLLSSIVLIVGDVIKPLIPALYILVYLALGRFIAPLLYGGAVGQGDMLLALLTSGTLFTTLFLLQWNGTTPLTRAGKSCYGIVAGILAFLIVGCGASPTGSIFTILVLNVISPLIQAVESLRYDRYVRTVLLPKSDALLKDGIHA